MAKRSAGGPNKSAAIREYLDSNPNAKPREIVDALKGQGLDVTPAFVSTIKSKSGTGGSAPKKRRGRPKAAAKTSGAGASSAAASSTGTSSAGTSGGTRRGTQRGATARRGAASGDTVSVDGLIRAKKLAEEMGGVDKVRAALAALEKITG